MLYVCLFECMYICCVLLLLLLPACCQPTQQFWRDDGIKVIKTSRVCGWRRNLAYGEKKKPMDQT